MRIAHVTCLYVPEHRGGAPLQCRAIAVEQVARGHTVAVFSGALLTSAPMLDVNHSSQEGVEVTRVVTTEGFPEGEERNWRHLAVEPMFRAFLREHQPEVVHFHSIQSLGASLLRVAKEAGARTVVTMHDLWWICQRQFCVDRGHRPCIPSVTPGSCACESGVTELQRRRAFLATALEDADLVLVPSRAMIDRLRMSGIGGHVVVDPNGVARPAAAGCRPAVKGRPLRLLYVGGQSRHKGVHVLAGALQMLSGRSVEYRADLHGMEGPCEDVRRLLDGLPARALPPFEPADRDAVMAAHDVLVVPSVMFESSSLAVREALVRGLAVVATEGGGPDEVIHHDVNGLLVPPDDAVALAGAIERLAREPGLLDRLAGAGALGEVPTPAAQVTSLERHYETARTGRRVARRRPAAGQVLFVAGIEGAPLRYRVHQKIEQLSLLGVRSVLRRYSDPRIMADLPRSQAVVVYRSPATRELVAFIRRAHQRGLPVLFDVDDLIFEPELAETLPSIAHLPKDERALWLDGVRRYRTTLLECGRGIASTPGIARHMEWLGVPARVHRNGVDTALAVVSEQARRARADSSRAAGDPFLVACTSGTTTHDLGLASVTGAVLDFARAHPEVSVALCGILRPRSELLRLGSRLVRVPFVGWERHARRLAACDLCLAPLPGGPFDEAKSAIKWSEAALVDVPTLASSTEPFREVIEHGRTGLLASDAHQWRERLEEALGDRDQLARLGRRARLAAYLAGSPWVLAPLLLDILGDLGGTPRAPAPPSEEGLPAEVVLSDLEPAGLVPGLVPDGRDSAVRPGEALAEHRVAFELPAGMLPLRRVDVRMATYGREVMEPVALTIRRFDGRPVRQVIVPPRDVGDNGWVAFEVDPPLDPGPRFLGELRAGAAGWVAPYVASDGRRLVDGRPRRGAVLVRTFHQPPLPSDPLDACGAEDGSDRTASLLHGVARRARRWLTAGKSRSPPA